MKSLRLKQFAISLLAVLSLFASSVSACACSHHQGKPQTETSSCHEHAAQTTAGQNHVGSWSETVKTTISETVCVCLQPSPKVSAKSENLKVEKHRAAILIVKPIQIAFIVQTVSAKIDFSKPSYLSDSFYNLSPGRAPPVL
jgi:hypothetical protein